MLPQSPQDNSSSSRGIISSGIVTEQLLRTDGVQRLTPCRRSTVLYHAGDAAAQVFYLESGLAKILREGSDGRDLLITIVRGGELFGEECLFFDAPRETTVEMLTDGVVYSIPTGVLAQTLRETPGAWEMLAGFQARRRRALERKLDLLFLRDVEQRILRTLLELAEIYGGSESRFSVQLSQSEVANLIGATRETTSTTLNTMARRGLISLGRRVITVPSIEVLVAASRNPESALETGTMSVGKP